MIGKLATPDIVQKTPEIHFQEPHLKDEHYCSYSPKPTKNEKKNQAEIRLVQARTKDQATPVLRITKLWHKNEPSKDQPTHANPHSSSITNEGPIRSKQRLLSGTLIFGARPGLW